MYKRIFAAVTVGLIILAPSSAVTAAPKVVLSESPVIIAHKTGPLESPGNTVAGILGAAKHAKDKGMDLEWEEIDINFNKSLFPVAYHGSDLTVTTDGTGLISDKWLNETQDLNAAHYSPWDKKNADGTWKYPDYHGKIVSGTSSTDVLHPPYGFEFMQAANTAGVNLLLDMQATPNQAQADKLYTYISNFNYVNKVIYMGTPASITAMKGFYPDITTMIIEYPPAGRLWSAKYLKSLGASGYVIRYDNVDKSVVDYYHANGLKLFTWVTDSPTTDVASYWTSMNAAGVDALITDHYVEAHQLLHP